MDLELHVDRVALLLDGALRAASSEEISYYKSTSERIGEKSWDDEEDSSKEHGELAATKQLPWGQPPCEQANHY